MTFTGFFILGSGIVLIAVAILPGIARYLRGGAIRSLRESPNYKYWGFIAIAIGLFSSVVDHGSVNVALPTIAEHFHTDLPTVQWVIIGYALTISATLLPMGRVSDMLGRKEVYLFGSVIYVISAALVGLSQHFTFLILFRIIQGIGAAMTQGTGMAIITQIFPPNERGRAIGLVMTIVGTGQVAGPAIGGGLVSWLGWRAVFFLNVPLVLTGIVATVMVLDSGRVLRAALGRVQGRFDLPGAVLSTGALVTMLLAIMYGHREGWTSGWILTAGASSAVLVTTFIFWELRASSPMLDVRFFRDRTFSFGVAAAFMIFLGSSAIQFLTPFYVQEVLGYSAVEAGLLIVPGAVCMSMLGPICGRLSDTFGWRKFTVGGLISSATGMLLMSTLHESSSVVVVIIGLILTSSGMGTFYSPNTSSVLSAVEPRNYGIISGFLNLIRNSANVSSVAMATAIVTGTMGSLGYEPTLAAVSCGGGAAVCSAFTIGTRNAYLVMASVLLTAASISAFKFQPRQQMVPAPSASD